MLTWSASGRWVNYATLDGELLDRHVGGPATPDSRSAPPLAATPAGVPVEGNQAEAVGDGGEGQTGEKAEADLLPLGHLQSGRPWPPEESGRGGTIGVRSSPTPGAVQPTSLATARRKKNLGSSDGGRLASAASTVKCGPLLTPRVGRRSIIDSPRNCSDPLNPPRICRRFSTQCRRAWIPGPASA